MMLNEPKARSILEAAHAAWSRQDFEEMLDLYHDDIVYYSNAGGIGGNVLKLYGKEEMRAFLLPVMNVADCISLPLTFNYRDDVGRAQAQIVIRHRESGMNLEATCRQFVNFQDFKIIVHEEFHDAERMRAFWALVQGTQTATSKSKTMVSRMLSEALGLQPRLPSQSNDE